MNCKQLFQVSEDLFRKRSMLMTHWQDTADNFYPERASFTSTPLIGQQFAANLTTSYPILARRDLGNAFSSMLRPTAKVWFHMGVVDDALDTEARQWLEWASGLQRKAMYDRNSLFTRATKEGDHDFAAFGQCVLTAQLNKNANGLLYRNWHLRDVAWNENEEGKIGVVFRKWKPTVREILKLFPKTAHAKVSETASKDPFAEVDCRHMVVESDMYDGKFKTPYVSIFYDCEHDCELEVMGVFSPIYVIPRWQTVSGSQYAYSPATIAALPDARLIQAMTLTLLEAGEKIVNPPMIGVQEAFRSDLQIFAGGFTAVDAAYDERLGEVLRPLTVDKSGMPLGVEMQRDAKTMIQEAFYLNKLAMPQRAAEMTAYEVGQRVQEYIRAALPLFEPMEDEYNGALCDVTFDLLLRGGAFGDPRNMPRALQGAHLQFSFESPLHDAVDQVKGQKFLESKAILADAAAIDPSIVNIVDMKSAVRDVLIGIGCPAKWTRSEAEAQAIEDQQKAQAQQQQLMATLQQGAATAKDLGAAHQSFGQAGQQVPAGAV